jgi:hypothetical protein
MKIKLTINDEDKEIDLSQYTASLSHSFFENKDNDKDVYYLKDISKITFFQDNTFMQMVDGIIDMCNIFRDSGGHEINLEIEE